MEQELFPFIVEFYNESYFDVDTAAHVGPEVATRFIINSQDDLLKFMGKYVNTDLTQKLDGAAARHSATLIPYNQWLGKEYGLTQEALQKFSDPALWRHSRFSGDYDNFCKKVLGEYNGSSVWPAMVEFKKKMDAEILGTPVSIDALEQLFCGRSPFGKFHGNNVQGSFEVHYPTQLD
jgi:hypothetical protein